VDCPPEIARVLGRMLEHGLVRIRALGWSGDADWCATEANHLHNLPLLLDRFEPDMLAFYWNVERVAYMAEIPPHERESWEPLWQSLESHLPPAAGNRPR